MLTWSARNIIYFAEELRREIQVDVEEVAEDERSFGRIARKTGMEAGEISRVHPRGEAGGVRRAQSSLRKR